MHNMPFAKFAAPLHCLLDLPVAGTTPSNPPCRPVSEDKSISQILVSQVEVPPCRPVSGAQSVQSDGRFSG